MGRRGTYRQVLITSNPESQHTCFTSSPYSSAAATPTEWQLTPATRVTLLLPGKECGKGGEILETALYWAGVVSVRLGAIAEKKVSQHSCVWGSVWV